MGTVFLKVLVGISQQLGCCVWHRQMLPSEFLNLDAVMERAMVRCIVKPLKEHIYRLFTYDLTRYYAFESDRDFT